MDTMTLVIVVGSVLLTVVIVGGVLFGVIRMFKKMGDDAAERARLLREGIQAGARVMGVQATGGEIIINGARSLGLMIQLEVHAPGRPPYPATMTTMISELQIPQIQPGAMLTIRIDRMNPANMALEAAGAPPPQNMSMQPGQGYRDQPMMQPGYPQMGMPMNQFAGVPPVPAGAKIGLWLGIGGALVGVIVAVVVVLVNVGGVGLDSANEATPSALKQSAAARSPPRATPRRRTARTWARWASRKASVSSRYKPCARWRRPKGRPVTELTGSTCP